MSERQLLDSFVFLDWVSSLKDSEILIIQINVLVGQIFLYILTQEKSLDLNFEKSFLLPFSERRTSAMS